MKKMIAFMLLAAMALSLLAGCGTNGSTTAHTSATNPQATPNAASILRAFLERYPNRNKPSIPPLKIEDKAHQASSALSAFMKAKATNAPMIPTSTLDDFSTTNFSRLPACLRKC